MIDAAFEAWARVLDRRRRWVALGLALVTLGALIALPRFRFDPNVGALLPEGHETVELLKATQVGERTSRTLFLLLRGESLEVRLEGLLESLADSPFLVEVAGTREEFGGDLATELARAPIPFLAPESLDQLERRLVGDERLEAIRESRDLLAQDPLVGREIVLRDPLGLRWILNDASLGSLPRCFDTESEYLLLDGSSSALLRVVGKEDPFDVEFSEALLADLEGRLAEVEFRAIGGYAVAREDAARIKGDLQSSLRWSIPLILLFLLVSTRSLIQPQLYLLPLGLAILWTFGFGGLLLGPLTPLAVSSAAILIGLGVDFSIHYVGRFREERRHRDLLESLNRTQRATGRALLGSMLTSVAAFLSIGLGSFPGLRSFALLLALGLFFALLTTWTVLPLLLQHLHRWRAPPPPGPVIIAASRLSGSRGALPVAASLVALAVLGWCVTFGRGVLCSADPGFMRPVSAESAQALADLERELGFSSIGVTVLVDADESLETLSRAAHQLSAEGLVAFSEGPHILYPTQETRERVRKFRARTVGWVEGAMRDLKQAGFNPEPFRGGLEELAEVLKTDPEPPARAELFHWKGRAYWKASFHPPHVLDSPAERAAFQRAFREALGTDALIVDPSGLADELGKILCADLKRSFLACSIVVLILVVASIGRVKAGLIALLPVLCGLGITLGLVSILGWPLHPGNFLAIPLILGLGVDDGIHMVLSARAKGGDPIRTTGVEVWRTTVTTSLGFGSLMTASSPAIASLGAIVLVGTIVCFLSSILLVPVMLRKYV